METNPIDLLVTFDKHYMRPFRTMLTSLLVNNPGERIRVWLLHSAIPEPELQKLEAFCHLQGVLFTPLEVDRSIFASAPISNRYPQEMYYRLLASHLLPESLDKVLYLDPDILIINSLRPLWTLPLHGYAFAAASHASVFAAIDDVNRVRLKTEHPYYNSGVMLMDLKKAREIVKPEEIFNCVRTHAAELRLPDQDVFNYLYGGSTVQVEDEIWNYDARYYSAYLVKSGGRCNLDWVMQNTAILHFCGKKKPWTASHTSRFTALYKHYQQLASTLPEGGRNVNAKR